MQHLEQEVKLDVDPGWSLPDLAGVLPGAHAVTVPSLALDAVYYDTADQRLAGRHITLRYRREQEEGPAGRPRRAPAAHIWTVKLPSAVEGNALSRTEISWTGDGAEPAGNRSGAPAPLAGAAEFVAAVTMGEPLGPVARVVTSRRRSELRTSDGRVLAEIAHDTVTGTNLVPAAGAGGARPPVHFTEVEVELAEGSSLEVLDAVAARLLAAGARRSLRTSKLMTVLQPLRSATGFRTGHPGADRAGLAARGRPGSTAKPTMGTVLQQQARACLDTLLEHDPPIRLGDPDTEHIHRSRVATRRLRSVLRAFAPLLATSGADDVVGAWLDALSQELRWLGGVLGSARDADVRLLYLQRACAQLSDEDAAGAASVLEAAADDGHGAHQGLLDAMASPRYLLCLRAIEALGNPAIEALGNPTALTAGAAPGPASPNGAVYRRLVTRATNMALAGPGALVPPARVWELLDQPAATALAALGRRQWHALRRAVARLGEQPSLPALHQVRIKAKRMRYIAEVSGPVLRPASIERAAGRTVKATTELQDVLGQLHDAAVNEQWLRDLASRRAVGAGTARRQGAPAPAVVATATTAGQLIAEARRAQTASRQAWPRAWQRVDSKHVRTWTSPGRR